MDVDARGSARSAKWTLVLAALMISSFSIFSAEESTYPRHELLAEPAQLSKPDDAKKFIILDARERAKYDLGHVPNARWVDHAAWSKAFGDGKDADGWSKRIGALGLDSNAPVVIYDDNFTKDAARIWWILRYWGVDDVKLLNGGWTGWTAAGNPVDKAVASPAELAFTAKAHAEKFATKEQVLKSLDLRQFQVVDARSEKEFCGTEKLAKRFGAIPGAKQLEWIDLLDKESHRFKSATELKKLFDQSGINLEQPTTTHCQSGGRASVMAFGLELMGAKNVANYYAGWQEWGNAEDTPVVPGKAKEVEKK